MNLFYFLILLFSISISSVFADVSYDDHMKNLTSGTDKQKIAACKFFGSEKEDKKALSPIIQLVKKSENPNVAVAAATALGYIKEKGEATTALKERIQSDTNGDVIYASLLSILNISIQNKGVEPDAKAALNYADANHRGDPFVADIIDKIKKKMNSAN